MPAEEKNSESPFFCADSCESLLENIPGAAYRCLFDKDWTMIFITDNILALSGYGAGGFIGSRERTYASIIHPEDASRVESSIAGAVEAGSPWEIEYRIIRSDKTTRWVFEKGRAVKNGEGGVAWLDGIILDITARKEEENARVESEARLAATLRSIGDGVISTNASGIVLDMNAAAESITGYSLAESAGKHLSGIFKIFKTGAGEPAADPLEAALREGRTARLPGDISIVGKNGLEKNIADSCAPIRDAAGSIIGAVLVFRDVTARRKARLREEFEMRFQRTVADVSARFVNISPDEFDSAVGSFLAYIGRLFEVDRSYLFMFSGDLEAMDNTHEWCAEGVEAHKERISNYPARRMRWLIGELSGLRPVHIPDVEGLPPEAAAEKAELKAQKVRSLILFPLRRGTGGLMGFLGFDSVRRKRSWSGNHILILQVVAEIIAGAISRLDAYKSAEDTRKRFESLAGQAKIIVWELDAGGMYVYVSPGVEDILGYTPGELAGKKHFCELSPDEGPSGGRMLGARIGMGEAVHNLERRLAGRNGRVVRVLTSGMPVADGKGYMGLDALSE